ncbi:MAG: TIGR00725 family protein [Halobacteriota archaeon]
MSNRLQVGVIGSSSCEGDTIRIAEHVGALVAAKGAILITGGMTGVMEAASRGAKKAGGLVVGILPGASKSESNPYVDVVIPTEMGHARNAIIARSSDCLIAIAGGFGTLSEVALALQMQRPVVTLTSPWKIAGTIEAHSAEDAVNAALSLCGCGKETVSNSMFNEDQTL